jgi:hypothetical protein
MTHPQTALMAAGCVRQVAEHDIGHSAETELLPAPALDPDRTSGKVAP